MTDEQLAAIAARAERGLAGIESEGGGPSGDARDTCATDVPALVAEVRRLQAEIAKLTAWDLDHDRD